MATRIHVPPPEPPVYQRTEGGGGTSPSSRGLVNLEMLCLYNVFVVMGLLLFIGLFEFAFEPVYIYILMAYLCCLFCLRSSVCSRSNTTQEPGGNLHPQVVLRWDDPSRCQSLPDLQPQVKVTLPSYEEACGYMGPPPEYRNPVAMVPVHRPY